MSRSSSSRSKRDGRPNESPSLADLLSARPAGLQETECWALLCQGVQALQDLFLSDGGAAWLPLVTPHAVLLSSRGKVRFHQNVTGSSGCAHYAGYLAPEYRPGKRLNDTNDTDKMWIFGFGETLKRATLTQASPARLSGDLCQVLADMTRPQSSSRASLMNLLDAISKYCRHRPQSRPFSHIVMDLHQEAMASLELALETPWGPPAMPQLRSLTRNSDVHTIPRRWMQLPKLTRDSSTSMEELSFPTASSVSAIDAAGKLSLMERPRSMCWMSDQQHQQLMETQQMQERCKSDGKKVNKEELARERERERERELLEKRSKVRRNPVHRAASRLYRAGSSGTGNFVRECVGPEFAVRASLPSKRFTMPDIKGSVRKTVTVILLNGRKLDVTCNPNTTTAGQLFELVIQKEHIEENFMFGLSALIAGDFVFLPSDTRICKAMFPSSSSASSLTLFMRVRFFLPSLRGIRGNQAKHLLYLQLRRSILEHQLPCSLSQLVELNGLALQAEFGDYNDREHGSGDYFLLEHYVPETTSCAVPDFLAIRRELIRSHQLKMGLEAEKAEEDFIIQTQTLPHYGGHFYTATWVLKDNTPRDVWLYISAQGINLYERPAATQTGPTLCEMFEWKSIQTLCYSKHYLCILPHSTTVHKFKKYKLKMYHKKSYFTFRLASLHHQFFLRLRTEFTTLNSLSQQFGVPLKDMKNERNSLCKLEALTNQYRTQPEFRIDFRASSNSSNGNTTNSKSSGKWKRSLSIGNFISDDNIESLQNKENESPRGLVLDSSCLSGVPNLGRRGVKMGVSAFSTIGQRICRSMEAVNLIGDESEQLSLQSMSIHCSSASIPSPVYCDQKPYVLDTSIRNNSLINFQESLSESLQEKLNKFSFEEERILRSVTVKKDCKGGLGMQITEGSDGKVYVQSVIHGGPAYFTGKIKGGDQVVAVDGKNLLSLKYDDALNLLKSTGTYVEFILSQPTPSSNASTLRFSELKSRIDLSDINESHLKSVRLERTMNKLKQISLKSAGDRLEKHLTESCHDLSNVQKYPYHKHIRYDELDRNYENEEVRSLKHFPNNSSRLIGAQKLSKSCMDIDRAVVIGMIAKSQKPAFPRSLGLSRKWRGPVRYPVTPIKRIENFSNSDDEQVFI